MRCANYWASIDCRIEREGGAITWLHVLVRSPSLLQRIYIMYGSDATQFVFEHSFNDIYLFISIYINQDDYTSKKLSNESLVSSLIVKKPLTP